MTMPEKPSRRRSATVRYSAPIKQRAVLVEPAGRHLVDDRRAAGREPHQVAVAAHAAPARRRRRARARHARTDAAPRRAPGSTICGRTQPIMSSSSARRGWPDTCTRWVRSVMTSTPWSTSPLMMRPTAFSLPGMVREEKITRSPLPKRHLGMLVLGDARERRARLALAAGAQRHHLVGRQMAVDVDAAEIACTPSR